jgi:hypothetical protein
MNLFGLVYYLGNGASYLYKWVGSGHHNWIPTTVAAYKIDYNNLINLLILVLLFACDLYAFVMVFQIAFNRFTQIVTEIISNNIAQAVLLIGLICLAIILLYVPCFSFMAYVGYKIMTLIITVILRNI